MRFIDKIKYSALNAVVCFFLVCFMTKILSFSCLNSAPNFGEYYTISVSFTLFLR